jgi:hypothetical protein
VSLLLKPGMSPLPFVMMRMPRAWSLFQSPVRSVASNLRPFAVCPRPSLPWHDEQWVEYKRAGVGPLSAGDAIASGETTEPLRLVECALNTSPVKRVAPTIAVLRFLIIVSVAFKNPAAVRGVISNNGKQYAKRRVCLRSLQELRNSVLFRSGKPRLSGSVSS